MAYVVFMKVDGYRSPDVGKTPGYHGWIIIDGIHSGANTHRLSPPLPRGLAGFQIMCITKRLGSSSSFFRMKAASGNTIKQIVFDVCEVTKRRGTRLVQRTTFKTVFIQRFQTHQMVVVPGKAAEVIEDIYFTWDDYSAQYT